MILGPHVAGKVVLILPEKLGCNEVQLAACLRWNNGSHTAAIRNLALATRNVTTPLTVKYLTPANDPVVGCMPPKFVRSDCLVNPGYSSTGVPIKKLI